MEFIVDCINISLSSFPPTPQFTHSSVHLSFLSLFIRLSVHPLTRPSLCSSIQPFICLSFCQSLCSTRRLSICSFIHPSIRWSVFFFFFFFSFFFSSIHPFVCFFVYPLLCPSFGQSLGLFVCSFIHSSVCLLVHLFIRYVCLFIHPSIRVSICSSIHPSSISSSVCLYVLPFILPSLCSLCVSSSVCQSVHSPVFLSDPLFVHPSLYVRSSVGLCIHPSVR